MKGMLEEPPLSKGEVNIGCSDAASATSSLMLMANGQGREYFNGFK